MKSVFMGLAAYILTCIGDWMLCSITRYAFKGRYECIGLLARLIDFSDSIERFFLILFLFGYIFLKSSIYVYVVLTPL